MSSVDTFSEPEHAVKIPFLESLILTRTEVQLALLAASILCLFACAISVRHSTWDDSYIIFHYVQNMVNGLGVVFNPGQRVEGYTGVLWIVVLAAGTRLTSDPIVLSKILGVLFAVSILLASYILCRLLARDRVPMYGFALLLTASNTHFIVGSVSGLETPLFSPILCWSLVAYLMAIRATRPQSQAGWCAGASSRFALL